jgi:two-component system, NtrC family, response regulator HydG
MKPSLVTLAGPLLGEVIALTDEPLTIGRDAANRLQPGDFSLSRQHCTVAIDHGRVTLTDHESLNGSFVNGVPVRARILEHGDQVKIGESVFLFLHHDAALSAPPTIEQDDRVSVPTVQLRKEDALYLQSDQTLEAFPPTPRRARDLHVLLRISTAIGSIKNANDLERALLTLVLEAVPAEHAAIVLAEHEAADFTSVVARARCGDGTMQISRTIVRHVIDQRAAFLSNDPTANDAFREAQSLIANRTHSVLCVPFTVSHRLFGALYLASSDPGVHLDEEHRELVAGIASLIGVALENVHHIERLDRENRELHANLTLQHAMIGESIAMQSVNKLIAKVAPSDSTVLILGESGTGKELTARAIHLNSRRVCRPFVVVNAAALAETLLESELFGHEKGAFTGAVAQKRGQLELAEGGTIFLDEVGDLSPSVQVKLLRVLQEREVTRVGGTRPTKIDVRFIAATNRDLEAAVKNGSFRQDLYYRLNVVRLRMPSLRERREDIPLLATYFLRSFSASCKRRVLGLSEDARACLIRYDWPGNVRELENAIERAVVLGAAERIRPDDLPESVLEQSAGGKDLAMNYQHALLAAKQQIVLAAIDRAGGDYTDAARQLGLHPSNLHRLIRNLALKDRLKKITLS